MEYNKELRPKISSSGYMLKCFDRYTGRKIILKISYIESAEEWLDNVLCIKMRSGSNHYIFGKPEDVFTGIKKL